jgi:hypothetical protein
MAATEKTISAFIESQLPDFINADHPKFKKFLEYYYEWLENNNVDGISNTAGNTLYHAMQIGDYRDIDETPPEFIKYFKDELAPYFAENSALDTRKIIKSAREFYSKKGSDESIRWLFKVLFNEDIELNYPKEQILIASDGKWIKPRAFRITSSETNKNVDVNLLEKRLVTGTNSGATCVVESANRTIDPTNGIEIIEIYISNIKRLFENGEYIRIEYVDANGVDRVFSEKIIGTISNLRIDSNVQTDPSQRRRGLLYNVGDPVVITGGLAATAEAQDGIGIVSNVSQGSIESVTTVFPGYGYRVYTDSEVLVFRSVGDDPNANLSTDLRLIALNLTSNTTNSQQNFIEAITYDKSVIDYSKDEVIGNANLVFFTTNNRNVLLDVTENDFNDDFDNFEQIWANGTNFFDALFTAKIATANGGSGGPFGAGVANATGGLLLYDIANTGALSTVLTGAQINTKNTAKSFVFNSITTYLVPANANSKIVQCLDFETVNTGGVALVSVINGGFGFRSAPPIDVNSRYNTQLSENYTFGTGDYANTVQTFKDLGQVAHVYIDAPGTGYANGDTISFSGRGYGGNGYVNVDSSGNIVSVTLTDRGEGYKMRPAVSISTSGGTGAAFTAYLFGDGFDETVSTSAIGRIRDLRLLYRGYDYIGTPVVSLKVVDTVINPIPEANVIYEQEYVYQGSSLATSTFRANVKSLSRTTNVLRLYNYSGTINPALDIITANGVYCNVNTSANVPAPAQYDPSIIATGLPNPMYYGNGRAKANAQFANGLIEFNGFFLNTDGFPSSDKVLQDDKLYHNFSYIVQSEKSLVEFETPLKNIAHPAGLAVVSKTVLRSEYLDDAVPSSNVDLILPINTSSTITVSNSYNSVVTGANTEFLHPDYKVNVGDLFIIVDSGNALRGISRVVAAVDSNTSLNVAGDFIYAGQGKLKTNNGNVVIQVSGNTNAVSDFLQAGDSITMNVRNLRLDGTVNVNGTAVTGNTTGANTTYFVGNVVIGSEILVNNEVRLVTAVTNNQSLTVNSAFTYVATNKYINANSVLVKTISSISGNNLTVNTAVHANITNLVYLVVPDYSSAGYSYKIVTLTDE